MDVVTSLHDVSCHVILRGLTTAKNSRVGFGWFEVTETSRHCHSLTLTRIVPCRSPFHPECRDLFIWWDKTPRHELLPGVLSTPAVSAVLNGL